LRLSCWDSGQSAAQIHGDQPGRTAVVCECGAADAAEAGIREATKCDLLAGEVSFTGRNRPAMNINRDGVKRWFARQRNAITWIRRWWSG